RCRRGRRVGGAGAGGRRNHRRARAAPGERSLAAARAGRPGWSVARALPAGTPATRAGGTMKGMHAGFRFALLGWLLVLAALPAQAQQVRAWLDRDRIALGETATLHIECECAIELTSYHPTLRVGCYLCPLL